jgi:hypothetical protein
VDPLIKWAGDEVGRELDPGVKMGAGWEGEGVA